MFTLIRPIRSVAAFLRSWGVLLVLVLPMLACGPTSEGAWVATDQVAPPESFVIGGAPQWVGLTATPIPTRTQLPTTTPYSTVFPPSGYATYTPGAGLVYQCGFVLINGIWTQVCGYASPTPFPGGFYSTPSYVVIGASSTPRPTFTPYPTATPCHSFGDFYFGEYVYSKFSDSSLDLRIWVGDVVTAAIADMPGFQTVRFTVEIQNRGSQEYYLFPQLQLFIAEVDSQWGPWMINLQAAEILGLSTTSEEYEQINVPVSQTKRLDYAGIAREGSVTALGWIMDPTVSNYQDRIVGGNVVYWRSGSRPGGCSAGAIPTQGIVPTLPAALPTASPTTDRN